jgi:hypothetical protein
MQPAGLTKALNLGELPLPTIALFIKDLFVASKSAVTHSSYTYFESCILVIE